MEEQGSTQEGIHRAPSFFGRALRGLVDSGVHGVVALLVTAPIIQSTWQLLALAFAAGTLVDVDHFLAAGPRSFWAATHLAGRLPAHSLTFALLASGGGQLFFGSRTTAWVVFAALTSHVLRDASVGTAPLLWPLVTGGYRGGSGLQGEIARLVAQTLAGGKGVCLRLGRWRPLWRLPGRGPLGLFGGIKGG